MSKLRNTKNRKRINRSAIASSAIVICLTVAGAVAPAHAGCNFYPQATVNWSNYAASSAVPQNNANNNGLVSVQPAAGANLNWSAGNYTYYGQYYGGNVDDREPLNGGNFYGRGRTQQTNTNPAVWRDLKIAEPRDALRGGVKARYVRPISQHNYLQSPRGNFSVGFDRIQIRGVGDANNIRYGRSLVQFNGQANLGRQIERIEVVRPGPTMREEFRGRRNGDR